MANSSATGIEPMNADLPVALRDSRPAGRRRPGGVAVLPVGVLLAALPTTDQKEATCDGNRIGDIKKH